MTNFNELTTKDALNYAVGANVFPAEFTNRFEIKSKSISNEVKAAEFIAELKSNGFSVKKKTFSEFISITAIKEKQTS